MRSYKSIERPAQVLGMNLQDLGIALGVGLGSALLLGYVGAVVKVPRILYLLVLVLNAGLLLGLRYLSKRRPPGFLLGWVSYTLILPRRVAVGIIPSPHEKAQNRSV